MPTGPELLRNWRIAADLTQAEAARELGSSQGTYSDWETGRKTPRLRGLLQIKRIAAIQPEAFSTPEPPITPEPPSTRGAPAAGDTRIKAHDRCACAHTGMKHRRTVSGEVKGCTAKGCSCKRFSLAAPSPQSSRRAPAVRSGTAKRAAARKAAA
jgi:DNA-binding XRE family transcriptional regulator